ncbi:hypothetical protein [Streptomyces sp. NPDC014733]|uniref:hypothetical protein n=1 Tax=Streptomyces sp. NPDC014733 TaxID=3364885 RepID=UPI00370138D5
MLKKVQAALLAATAVAGIAVSAAPAQASDCKVAGLPVICEFTVAGWKFDDGVRQEFAISTDTAMYTRWTDGNGNWGGWQSMGGSWTGPAHLGKYQPDSRALDVSARGTDGEMWHNQRSIGGSWSGWWK